MSLSGMIATGMIAVTAGQLLAATFQWGAACCNIVYASPGASLSPMHEVFVRDVCDSRVTKLCNKG